MSNMNISPAVDPALIAYDIAAAEALERKKQKFRRKQVVLTNKFRRHRMDVDHSISLEADAFPMHSDRRHVQHMVMPLDNPRQNNYRIQRFGANYRRSINALSDVDKRRYSRSRINEVSRKLFAFGIRFRRVISCGGMGMAALFEVQNRSTGLYNKIVAKIALSERYNKDIAKEKKYLDIVGGDDHFLKLKNVKELRSMAGGYPSEAVRGTQPADPSQLPEPTEQQIKELDADDNIMLTEYLPFGSLNHWIGKASELRQEFSNEACWRMLLCLAKAAQAMRHPPSNTLGSNSQGDDIVHFDLDPTNILVDGKPMMAHANGEDYDDLVAGVPTTCDHDRSLLLKVADFGTASTISDILKRDYQRLWLLRTTGKPKYYTPEQWTAEWDAVRENPLDEDMLIAGNYTAKTNIFQIGIIMMTIMMRTHPDPVPRIVLVQIADFRDENHAYLDQTEEENAALLQAQLHTLGWIMAQEDCIRLYEPSLRELVIRMTAYAPHHRPTPAELVKICEDRIDRGFAGAGIFLDDASWVNARNIPIEAAPLYAYRPSQGAVNEEPTTSEGSEDPNNNPGQSPPHPLANNLSTRQAEAALALAELARAPVNRPIQPRAPVAPVGHPPMPSPSIIQQNFQQQGTVGQVANAFAGLPLSTRGPPSAVPFFGAPILRNESNGPMLAGGRGVTGPQGPPFGLQNAGGPQGATSGAHNASWRSHMGNAADNARHERAMQAVFAAHQAQIKYQAQAARDAQAAWDAEVARNAQEVEYFRHLPTNPNGYIDQFGIFRAPIDPIAVHHQANRDAALQVERAQMQQPAHVSPYLQRRNPQAGQASHQDRSHESDGDRML